MNCSSFLPSLVCILSAGFACGAGAQSLPDDAADTPVFASSALLAPPPLQHSAQLPAASAVAVPDASRPVTSEPVVSDADARARRTLRRPLVPSKPGRPRAASVPDDSVWSSDKLYASPYATSPYASSPYAPASNAPR
ncbi:hypothetical protein ACVBGC_00485 [Burkholderia stagnalis]